MSKRITYFWSGSNRAGEIKALNEHGTPYGVAVDVLDKAGSALREIVKSKVPVFVDSGAFGEVRFSPAAGGFETVREITHEEWIDRLGTYTYIAERIGDLAYVVAPDKVGDQAETLRRLATYAPIVNHLIELGANVIVPLQKGELSQADFDREVQRVLGHDRYIRGVPSKKAAATIEEIGELSAALPADARIHLLGLSPWGSRWEKVLEVIRQTDVFADSVRITALVGRSNGPGGGPRLLTRRTDEVVRELGLEGKKRLSSDESTEVKYSALLRVLREIA